MNNDEQFPAYRRSHGGTHLYKITAPDRFEELQRIGKHWVLHTVVAAAYPEKVRVQEMLERAWSFEDSDAVEWSTVMALARV